MNHILFLTTLVSLSGLLEAYSCQITGTSLTPTSPFGEIPQTTKYPERTVQSEVQRVVVSASRIVSEVWQFLSKTKWRESANDRSLSWRKKRTVKIPKMNSCLVYMPRLNVASNIHSFFTIIDFVRKVTIFIDDSWFFFILCVKKIWNW